MSKDLFGEEREYLIVGSLGKIQKIKKQMGYRLSSGERKCKNCESKRKFDYHDKTYYKCVRIGFSGSEATDIRLKNVCDWWKSDKIKSELIMKN